MRHLSPTLMRLNLDTHAFHAQVDEPWLELAFLPPALLDDEGRRLWIEEMDFDPRPVFARVSCPTLLFYGSEDSWSPVAPTA